jgi:AcrR family transcriptional regulator
MCEIAERARAAIGSLYQFFPNKESIACALHTQCGEDIEQLWTPLLMKPGHVDMERALHGVIQVTVDYIDSHPAVIALQHAPKCTWNETIRKRLEQRIATFFMSCNPDLPRADANLFGSVCMEIIRSCSEQYLRAERAKRKRVVAEYKALLGCYAHLRISR